MILDIIIILLLIFIMIYGYIKGCVNIIMKLLSLILSFIAAYYLGGLVGNFIKCTDFGQRIESSVESNILNGLATSEENSVVTMIKEAIGQGNVAEIGDALINYIFMVIGFVFVFIAVRIILWIVKMILENIFELPVLKSFNKVGGVIVATILFVFEISIILAIMKSISTLTFMTKAIDVIESSIIIKVVYEHNIVTSLVLGRII